MLRFLFILGLGLGSTSPARASAHDSAPLEARWSVAEAKLLRAKLGKDFVASLGAGYQPAQFAEVVELNTLLFLRKSDYHGTQVTPDAAADVRKFVSLNPGPFARAGRDYAVPAEVIASLLWIESRHGQVEGRFQVASVFVDLLQCDQPATLSHLYSAAHRYKRRLSAKDRADIRRRARKRVQWALGELKAVQKMWRRNPYLLNDFKGSFAGAFGMPQFEPSSYVQYAKAYTTGRPADLESAPDAVLSVAFYLHQSGWKKSRKSQIRALMKYNNSRDYALAILKMADLAKDREQRAPSGKQEL